MNAVNFYLSKDLCITVSTKILSITIVFNIDNNKKVCFLNTKFGILEWFLKNLTLITEVMAAEYNNK